jgi:hypothetical protein
MKTLLRGILATALCVVMTVTGAFPQTLGNTNGQGPFAPGAAYSYNQFLGPFFQSPNVSFTPTSLQVSWTAGFLYVGNGSISVPAGAVTLTASKTTCSRANIIAASDSCNYIYATSAGVIAATVAISTAVSGGNSLLAMATTSASGVTSLQAPYQDTGGAGGGITVSGMFTMSASCTGAISTAALGIFTNTCTFTGLASGDLVWVLSLPIQTTTCPLSYIRATATNTLTLTFNNDNASTCTPPTGTYIIMVAR